MDPNANLAEQERLLTAAMADDAVADDDLQRLAVLRVTLRNWLLRGGFAPDWTRAPRASRFYRRFMKS